MKNTTRVLLVLLIVSTLFIAGCTQQQKAPLEPQTAQPTVIKPSDTIGTAITSLGTILVDAKGMSLYYFANDIPSSSASTCTGKCAEIWPIFSTDTIQVSSPLDPADFRSITRADGTKQTTYYGWPLYYYQADTKPGDVKGENVNKIWFVVKPDESVLIAQTPVLGLHLTDTSGKTLYIFTKDTPGLSTCTGSCSAQWPAFSTYPITAPSVLNQGDFSTLTRTDGLKQTAFKGMPLYYYAGDTKPGDIKGQKYNFVWYAANITGITVIETLKTLSPSYGSSY